MGTKFWLEKLTGRKYLGDLVVGAEDNDKMNLEEIRHKGAGSNHMTKDKDMIKIPCRQQ
jgi:hypothetical protein